jgi:ZIP family zinc transporter
MWAQAGFWGFVAGAALLIGAAAGYFLQVPQRVIAAIMAFGSGVLISALSFELMDEAYRPAASTRRRFGFLGGARSTRLANWWLAHRGAKHRKRSGCQQPSESEDTAAAAWRSPSAPCSTVFRNRS